MNVSEMLQNIEIIFYLHVQPLSISDPIVVKEDLDRKDDFIVMFPIQSS